MPGSWSLNPHVSITSPTPFNITTGSDNNGDTLFTDRPAFVSPDDPRGVSTRFGFLTPFPEPGDELIPRNLGRETWLADVSLSLSKSYPLPRGSVSVGTNVQNLLNQTRLTGFGGTLLSPTFGQPTSAQRGRRVDLTLRYSF